MAAREDTAQPAGLHLSISEEGKTARSSQGEKTNTTQKSESSVHLKFDFCAPGAIKHDWSVS